jgi:ABC-type multidrug transport system ATPase subunit
MAGSDQRSLGEQTAPTPTPSWPRIIRTDEVESAATPDRVLLDRGLTVGRQAMPGQVVLEHPNVSRRHAAFEVVDGTIVLRDLGGTNGTYVNGTRLRGARRLVPGDRIDIGPFELIFDGTALTRALRVGNVELLVHDVSFDVPGRRSGAAPQRILHAANLRIRPSEFAALIGANGSGKSTLMNIMAGRAFPSEGVVLLNGGDLHGNFAALKQDIAFVPQQDILHELLTLRQALDYAAQLRLPPDTTIEQRRAAVNDAARNVDLLDRLDQRIGSLSGGQKKCASLASEILNRPSLLLLDEVTSGLDESTDWEIMRLLRRLADDGMTIVMVTHTLANVTEFCDKIVCMGRGGQPTFVGAPSEVMNFFAVSRLGEVFSRTDEVGAENWRDRFEATVGASANWPTAAEARGELPPPDRQALRETLPATLRRITRQGAILLHRNVRLLLADRRTLVMAVAQSVLIGGLMGYAFGNFGAGQERVNAQNALLLLLGLSAIWLGCNAASKDIVGELAIYRREHDINLSTAAFIGAKYLVSSVFTVLQLAVVYVLAAALSDGIPGDLLEQFLLLTIGAMAGTAMGLVISAFANTRDQATTIVPLALVPQLILAGVLVPKLPDLAVAVAKIAVSGYWLIEAMKSVFIAADGPIRVISAHTGTLMDMTAEPAARGAAIVAVQALAFLVIAYVVTLLRHGGRDRAAPG